MIDLGVNAGDLRDEIILSLAISSRRSKPDCSSDRPLPSRFGLAALSRLARTMENDTAAEHLDTVF
jgi:hypothetical protein